MAFLGVLLPIGILLVLHVFLPSGLLTHCVPISVFLAHGSEARSIDGRHGIFGRVFVARFPLSFQVARLLFGKFQNASALTLSITGAFHSKLYVFCLVSFRLKGPQTHF